MGIVSLIKETWGKKTEAFDVYIKQTVFYITNYTEMLECLSAFNDLAKMYIIE